MSLNLRNIPLGIVFLRCLLSFSRPEVFIKLRKIPIILFSHSVNNLIFQKFYLQSQKFLSFSTGSKHIFTCVYTILSSFRVFLYILKRGNIERRGTFFFSFVVMPRKRIKKCVQQNCLVFPYIGIHAPEYFTEIKNRSVPIHNKTMKQFFFVWGLFFKKSNIPFIYE